MNVDDLLVFVRVVQLGSFSQASRQLGMPKSTVSRKVADLEIELGVPLLHRTTRSLRITDAGQSYLQHGLRIAHEVEQAQALIHSFQTEPQGLLRVTAPTDFGNHFLGGIIRDYLKNYPKISVDLVLTERVVDLISEGFDLAIRLGELDDSSLLSRKLGSLDMELWASPSYLQRYGEPKNCAELAQHSCLIFTGEDLDAQWNLQNGQNINHSVQVKGRIQSNNIILIQEFAVQGQGIALLPSFMCLEDAKKNKLKPILNGWFSNMGVAHAVYPGQKLLLPKVRTFIDHLLKALSGFEWRYRV